MELKIKHVASCMFSIIADLAVLYMSKIMQAPQIRGSCLWELIYLLWCCQQFEIHIAVPHLLLYIMLIPGI